MPFLLGTDEAGYGPNLGPLVISASVWEVPEGVRGDELYPRLQTVIAPAAVRSAGQPRSGSADGQRVAIADSKVLYQSQKGLRLLERGLWAAWSLIDRRPAACGDVWKLLTGPDAEPRCAAFCNGWDPLPAPRDFDAGGNRSSSSRLVRGAGPGGRAVRRSAKHRHLSPRVQRHG